MSTQAVADARSWCRDCPVWVDCLYTALYRREPHGVWGGMTVRNRTILLKRAGGNAGRAMRILASDMQKVGK